MGGEAVDVEGAAVEVESRRAGRASEVEDLRVEKATRLALERSTIDAGVRADIQEHTRRLAEINGSIGKTAESMASVHTELGGIHIELAKVTAALLTQQSDQVTRDVLARESVAGTATSRQLWIAVAAVVVTGILGTLSLMVAVVVAIVTLHP
jgi:hypothetical protein